MSRVRLLPTVIPVLCLAGPGSADRAAEKTVAPQAEVGLKAGELNSRAVAAGARVMVVHARGERHPGSGEWARLDTSAGYVQAVEAGAPVRAREGDLRPERISLARIDGLVMGGPASVRAQMDTMGPARKPEASAGEGRAVTRQDAMETGERIARKLGAGALGGVVGAWRASQSGSAWAQQRIAQEAMRVISVDWELLWPLPSLGRRAIPSEPPSA